MASQVTPFTISAPGYLGLNLQDSPVGMAPEYALEATNCIIDAAGRIGSRRGWARAHTSNADLGVANITCINEVVQNDGVTTLVATGNGMLFKHAVTTLTRLTYGGGGAAPVITANNWQFCQLNGIGVFFQRGHDPLVFDPATLATASTTTFRRLSETTGYAGTVPQANCAISAYGRIWAADTTADKNTVRWSDVITPQIWTGGSSGSLNLLGVWPSGGDEIVALAAHNNFLIIFGKKQTLIYSGANNPATMVLHDTLTNVGCIARDSVQNTGEDVIFLSDTGVRALLRTIQEKSSPLRELSTNVRDEIQSRISVETLANIKSGYSPVYQYYMLTFPSGNETYCFNLRVMAENGGARVTVWSLINPKAFFQSGNRKMYLGQPGFIGEYSTYQDDTSSYRMAYYTPWIDFGDPIQTSILKRIIFTIIGGVSQTAVIKWAFDYLLTESSQSVTLDIPVSAEYNIAEYNSGAEYSGNLFINRVSINGGGAGQVVRFGFEAQVNGKPVAIQKADIYTKNGRL